jgi:hypothetical protein
LEILNKNIKMTEELNLSKLFANFVKFISRNSKLLLVIVVIGVAGVIGYQKLKTPYYETKAICMSGISEYERQEQIEDLSQRTAIDLINHLQINIENEDFNVLAILLGVEDNVASKIKKIEAEQLYQQDMNEKFYALNKFEIYLTVFDNAKISKIQNGLVHYFDHNKFVQKYYERYGLSNKRIVNDIENERKVLGDIRVAGNNVSINSGQDEQEISNDPVSLSIHREAIITKDSLLVPLEFVADFPEVNQKEDDILVWTGLAAVLSFIFGLFVAVIREVKTK